jgi:competence protein ComEC
MLLLRTASHTTRFGWLLAGVSVGFLVSSTVRGNCGRVLPLGEQSYQLELIDPGTGFGRVNIVAEDCTGTIMARWPRTRIIPAGVTATVQGRWLPQPGLLGRPGGTLLVARVEGVRGVPDLISRSRTAVVVNSRRMFGDNASLVEALIGGWRGRVDPEVRDEFAATGLIHMLSISGFHIALVAAWVSLICRLGPWRSRVADIAGVAAALAYTAWLGWPAPATRAAVLLSALVLTRIHQRHVRADGLLGASALMVLLIDPWSVVDLGAWLSFAAITGVTWMGTWSKREFGAGVFIDTLAASTGAMLATAPIAALMIGRVAPIGLLLNFVAIPLTAFAMPAALLALISNWLAPATAAAFAASASLILDLLRQTAHFGATLPGAAAAAETGWVQALPWLVALIVAVLATHGRATRGEAGRRVAWGFAVMIWWPLAGGWHRPASVEGGLALHFLDVGQGDATAIRTPGGYWAIIDAGPSSAQWDAGERVVIPFLARHRVARIDLMVLSHPHRDHVGGAASVIRKLPLGLLLDPGEPFAEATYLESLGEAASRGTRWRVPKPGDRWELDGVTFSVIHPPATWPHRGDDPNEDSLVLLVSYGDFSALFTGDAGFAAESLLVENLEKVDVLKVGHHGSRGSTGEQFLQRLQPRAAIISLGRNNYGHPASATLGRLKAAGVELWRTDHHGTISVTTNGTSYTITGGRSATTHDAR